MKKLTVHSSIPFLLVLFFLISCGNGKKDNKKAADTDAASASMGTTSCFKQFSNHLDQMLTKADIAKVYKDVANGFKANYDSVMGASKSSGYAEYDSYLFIKKGDPDRKARKKVMGKDYGPKPYKIGVKNVHPVGDAIENPVEWFHRTYKTPTEKDKKQARKAIKNEMKDHDEVSEEAKKAGENMASGVMNKLKFSKVDGVGDAAAWDYFEGCLKVLKGRAIFDVKVDISDDYDDNVKLAKKLAQVILGKCNE